MKKTVSILLTAILSVGMLVGCGKKETPTSVVDSYFSTIKKSDTKEAQKFIENTIPEDALNEQVNQSEDSKKTSDKDKTTMDKSFETYLSKMDAKVLSEKIKGDKATVNVKVTAPNYSELLLKVMEESIANTLGGGEVTQSDVEKSLLEKLKISESETRTGKINLTKKQDKWEIKKDEDITNLLLGKADETESTMFSK